MEELQKAGWSLNEDAIRELNAGDAGKTLSSKDKLLQFALNTDLKEISLPILDQKLNRQENVLRGPVVMQISKIRDANVPKANEYASANSAKRLLRVFFTDGHASCSGFEVEQIKSFSLNTPPGTKVLLSGEIKVEHGFLMLNNKNFSLLGGNVKKLVERWEVNKDSLAKMRTRGVNRMGAEGPPPWVPFGKRIQSIKTGTDRNFKSLDPKKENTANDEEAPNEEDLKFKEARQAQIAELKGSSALKKFQSAKPQISIQPGSSNDGQRGGERNRTGSDAPRPSAIRTTSISSGGDHASDRGGEGRGGRRDNPRRGRRNSEDDMPYDPENVPKAPSGPSTLFDFLPTKTKQAAAPYQHVPSKSQEEEKESYSGRGRGRGGEGGRGRGRDRDDRNRRPPPDRRGGPGLDSREGGDRRGGDRGGRGGFRDGGRGRNEGGPPPPPAQQPPREFQRNQQQDRNRQMSARASNNFNDKSNVELKMRNLDLNSGKNFSSNSKEMNVNRGGNYNYPPPQNTIMQPASSGRMVVNNSGQYGGPGQYANYMTVPPPVVSLPGAIYSSAQFGGGGFRAGQQCLAPWRDNRIYTAEILGVMPTGMATVRYVDYGEIMDVPVSALLPSYQQPPPQPVPMQSQRNNNGRR